eukprot:TRINITY_DN23140_c0_g1_i1.p1 TRINITY_DN23140_c0_g1~~TRINITY_DN23140_c0_g1_i1.p1  ORF type:complete len:1055 (+),score=164.37 TRINITY_DN23140_c0_g1_i1:91-3165(+)
MGGQPSAGSSKACTEPGAFDAEAATIPEARGAVTETVALPVLPTLLASSSATPTAAGQALGSPASLSHLPSPIVKAHTPGARTRTPTALSARSPAVSAASPGRVLTLDPSLTFPTEDIEANSSVATVSGTHGGDASFRSGQASAVFLSKRVERFVRFVDHWKVIVIVAWVVAVLSGFSVAIPFFTGRGYDLRPVQGMASFPADEAFQKYFPHDPVPGALLIKSATGEPLLKMVPESSCQIAHTFSGAPDGGLQMQLSCVNASALGGGCITRAEMIRQLVEVTTPLLRSVASEAEVDRIVSEELRPTVNEAMPDVGLCPEAADPKLAQQWLGLHDKALESLRLRMPNCEHDMLSVLSIPPQPFSSELTVRMATSNLTVRVSGELPAGSFWTLLRRQVFSPDFAQALMSSRTSTCDGHALEQYSDDVHNVAVALQDVVDAAPESLVVHIATGRALVESMLEGIEKTMLISTLMAPAALLIVAKMVGNPRLVLITAFNLVACISCSTFVMWLVANVVEVNMFVSPLMVAAALAMSIDYSLFLLTRFQKETLANVPVFPAVVAMLETSGRIVLVSGTILFLCFGAIGAFPGDVILSMGIGASVAVFAGVLAALTFTPAVILAFPNFFTTQGWGPLGRFCASRCGSSSATSATSCWWSVGAFLLRWAKPLLLVLVILAIPLAFFSFPLYQTSVGPLPCMPDNSEVKHTLLKIEESFGMGTVFPTRILIVPPEGSLMTAANRSLWFSKTCNALKDIAETVNVDPTIPPFTASAFAGKMIIDGTCTNDAQLGPILSWSHVGGNYSATEVLISYSLNPFSIEGRDWIQRLRGAVKQHEEVGTWFVDGDAVYHWDYATEVGGRFPHVLMWMTGLVFLCMLVFSRSLVSPLRALLCLAWMLVIGLGLTILAFQLEDGSIYWMVPIISMPMMIGLGFDYDVFYTEAVVERCERGDAVAEAAVRSLANTADTITAAGVIMVLAFVPLLFGSTAVLRQISLLLILGVLVDCFVSTKFVVPAAIGLMDSCSFWPRRFK